MTDEELPAESVLSAERTEVSGQEVFGFYGPRVKHSLSDSENGKVTVHRLCAINNTLPASSSWRMRIAPGTSWLKGI
jgi:hypothetical protein